MPSKEFSSSFKGYFKQEADYDEAIWSMDYMDELDEDLASDLATAMAKVKWNHSPKPLWSFGCLVPMSSKYEGIQFNERGSSQNLLVAIEFNGIELCPQLVGPDQYDRMAGLFGFHILLEQQLRENYDFNSGFDIGECVQLAQSAIAVDRKAGYELYAIPKAMQSLTHGPEVVLYFYGLLSKALGYAFFDCGQQGLLKSHMSFYDDCDEMWDWFTKETAKQSQ